MLKVKFAAVLMIMASIPVFSQYWYPVESNFSTTINKIAFDNSDHLYIAPNQEGLLKTDISTKISGRNLLRGADVQDIIATKERNIIVSSFDGIFYSDKSGKNWENVDLETQFDQISDLSEGNDGNYYAVNGFIHFQHNQGVVLRSADNGKSWESTDAPQGLYSCAIADEAGNILAGTFKEGIKFYDIQTKVWKSFNEGLDSDLIHDIYIDQNNEYYAVAAQGKGYPSGIWQYIKDEEQWQQLHKFEEQAMSELVVDNNENFYITIFNDGLWMSQNSGNSWESLENESTPNAVLLAINNSTIYKTTDGGPVYSSKDNGKTWSPVFTAGCTAHDVIQRKNGDIWVATKHGLYIKNRNKPQHGFVKETSLNMQTVNITEINDSIYIIDPPCCTNSRIIKTNNNFIGVLPFMGQCYTGNGSGVYYAGTARGLKVSTTQGQKWDDVESQLPGGRTANVHILTEGGGTVIAVINSSRIYKISAKGTIWEAVLLIDDITITDIEHLKDDIFYFSTRENGIYELSVNEKRAYKRTYDLPDITVNDLVTDSENYVLAATEEGVFAHQDSLDYWQEVNNDLLGREVLKLTFGNEHKLIASTYSRGLYSTHLALSVEDSKTGSERLFYKNPYEISGAINYIENESSYSKILVFNMQGQIISKLHEGFLSKGMHTFRILKDLTPGCYFIQVIKTDEIISRSLMIN